MEWAADNAYLSRDTRCLHEAFRYDPRKSLAIRINKNSETWIWSLETENDWSEWTENALPSAASDSGLILILARRKGERPLSTIPSTGIPYSCWRNLKATRETLSSDIRRAETFAGLDGVGDETQDYNLNANPRQPGIQNLPFSLDTFRSICEKFHVHSSIVKTIARTTVPSFSHEKVYMEQPAHIYHCRTSSSWSGDVAVSATHFPAQGLTYAILYGCTSTAEDYIMKKLYEIRNEAYQPLLMAGIVAELELVRHIKLVENSIIQVETKILELDSGEESKECVSQPESARIKEEKRSAWLDLAYLRNSLITWNAQIKKMSKLLDEFTASRSPYGNYHTATSSLKGCEKYSIQILKSQVVHFLYMNEHDEPLQYVNSIEKSMESVEGQSNAGARIKSRLELIHEEYEEKIRDCTMRIDGMAMATKWSHSETAADMSRATNRESRVMKSISLVTMVFLPGTFFATVFSMSFFNWFGTNGDRRVSSYLWIYVVVTVLFTGLTIGIWYFFVIYRRPSRKISDEELYS